jgi:hypothetical protein
VAVINLPIMVEDPTHSANIHAYTYSKAVVELVARKYPGVSMVDFQSACRQHMAQHSPKWQQASQQLEQQQQHGSSSQHSSSQSPNGAQASSAGIGSAAAAAAAQPDGGSGGHSSSSSSWVMSKYSLAWNMAWSKLWQSLLMRQSWNAISSKQGLLLLTDQVHINDTAARILADLVQPLLQEL